MRVGSSFSLQHKSLSPTASDGLPKILEVKTQRKYLYEMPAQRSGMARVLAKEEYTRKEATHVPGKKLFVVFIALDGFTIYSNLISSRAMPVAN